MKSSKIAVLTVAILLLLFGSLQLKAQNPENWSGKQLIEPAILAKDLETSKDSVTIISVGPGAIIPNSYDAGIANSKEGINELKDELGRLPKDSKVVIYCGCCPFDHCPNVRPAIALLQEMKFTNYYLLNLPHNVKTDWIEKGFPVIKQQVN